MVVVTEEARPDLEEYSHISIAFDVRETLEISGDAPPSSIAGFVRRPVPKPYVKDYDDEGVSPRTWAARFDLSHWRFFVARVGGQQVGGAAVVFRAPDIDTLGGEPDLALLWDLRVAPEMRGRGIGAALVSAARAWCVANGAKWLEVETQNINVSACRFYERQGFTLRAINYGAYPTLPNEVQLIWRKTL